MSKDWVIEFHYEDGTIGAHPANEADRKCLSGGMIDLGLAHVLLRPDNDAGQERSAAMHEAISSVRRQVWQRTQHPLQVAVEARTEKEALDKLARGAYRILVREEKPGGWEHVRNEEPACTEGSLRDALNLAKATIKRLSESPLRRLSVQETLDMIDAALEGD